MLRKRQTQSISVCNFIFFNPEWQLQEFLVFIKQVKSGWPRAPRPLLSVNLQWGLVQSMQQDCSPSSKARKHHISRMVRHWLLASLPVEGRVLVEEPLRRVSICLHSSYSWALSLEPLLGTSSVYCRPSQIIALSWDEGRAPWVWRSHQCISSSFP